MYKLYYTVITKMAIPRPMLPLCVATAAACAVACAGASAQKKNVLFFAVDDLRMQFHDDHVPGARESLSCC